jgi:hypothetical protein
MCIVHALNVGYYFGHAEFTAEITDVYNKMMANGLLRKLPLTITQTQLEINLLMEDTEYTANYSAFVMCHY